MRAKRDAPVDSMGCERCCDPAAEPRVQRYQTLVSLMLSSQTKDPVTFAATKRLIEHGLTPENIAATDEETVAAMINKVGFWRQKARYIKATTDKLLAEHAGDIPASVEGLIALPGVGPKMAYICMSAAWGQVVGIGVDTHVHRISNRLGWVSTSTPEATRAALEAFVPKPLWKELNILLVGFGQQICQPVKPACEGCLNRAICPVGSGLRPVGAASPGKAVSKSGGAGLEW